MSRQQHHDNLYAATIWFVAGLAAVAAITFTIWGFVALIPGPESAEDKTNKTTAFAIKRATEACAKHGGIEGFLMDYSRPRFTCRGATNE